MIDEIEIVVQSGKGGDGAVHFHREKYVPRGGPDGGDGGKGASIIFSVQEKLSTLNAFRYQSKFFAEDGKPGAKNNMSGRAAEDLIIEVPRGTIVTDMETGDLLGDLVKPGQQLVVVTGGRGGRGNQHFATSRHQVPKTGEKGEPGQRRVLKLELKLIADVGIVGLPNAGKSSLLAAATNAKPKVADYPFTTLEPYLGVAELDAEISMVLADFPGLIEGAHKGVGLGFTFLRHIQRTRVLIHVLDGTSADPLADFTQINNEMGLFDPVIIDKPQVVVLNKCDLPDVMVRLPAIKLQFKNKQIDIHHMSAMNRDNVQDVLWKAYELLQKAPPKETADPMPVYRSVEDPTEFRIESDEGGWRVHGKSIERAAAMTYWEHEGSVRRFQRLMDRMGVDEALKEAGAIQGDSVWIGEFELEYED